MDDTFYITTPIYYVNDQPHIGHAYTTILADVLTRYYRLFGKSTYFLTGTDEHGQKVWKQAQQEGMTPQKQADATVIRFQSLWKKLKISNDDFIRTTEIRHTSIVQKILTTLYNKNEIYKAEYNGWYCIPCERFFTEKDLKEGNCPECDRAVDKIQEENYFFKMSSYQEWLINYIKKNPSFIQPDFRRNETLGFLNQPLNDLCISRPKKRLSWGIELPFDTTFVTYVWFDALVNYISSIGYLSDEKKFNKMWPATYHLIGKDILTTHTVYWPIMLKAMDLALPKTIFAHGFWLIDNIKMGKSLGNAVDPINLLNIYGSDPFRYILMAEMTLGQDANFSEKIFVSRYNADLANDLGNLLSRVTKLITLHFNGKIPSRGKEYDEERDIKDRVLKNISLVEQAIKNMKLEQGIKGIGNIIRAANRYLEQTKPWVMAKQKDERLGTILYTAADVLRILSGLLHPIMPDKMSLMRTILGINTDPIEYEKIIEWGALSAGQMIGKPQILFPRIELSSAKKVQKESHPKRNGEEKTNFVDYAEFKNIKLKTAKILEANKIKDTDKLLKLSIEIGEEKRQLVAGIARHYVPNELVGKEIVVVTNLKPTKIKGVLSEGMLLAAFGKDQLSLITPDIETGSGVEIG